MDDIDERMAFARLAEPLLAHLEAAGAAREAAFAEMWRERASLTGWLLLLLEGAGPPGGPRSGH